MLDRPVLVEPAGCPEVLVEVMGVVPAGGLVPLPDDGEQVSDRRSRKPGLEAALPELPVLRNEMRGAADGPGETSDVNSRHGECPSEDRLCDTQSRRDPAHDSSWTTPAGSVRPYVLEYASSVTKMVLMQSLKATQYPCPRMSLMS